MLRLQMETRTCTSTFQGIGFSSQPITTHNASQKVIQKYSNSKIIVRECFNTQKMLNQSERHLVAMLLMQ